jgi:uncharacterized membrane protein YbhN (UPF0104 family)
VRFKVKTSIERTRAESAVFMLGSALIALGTFGAMVWVAGFERVLDRLLAIDPVWFAVALGAEALAYLGYTLSYREVVRVEQGQVMLHRDAAAAVAAGFGPFVARGGFTIDRHAFKQVGLSDRDVRVRIMGLGALEYALLAPAACIVAIQLLVNGAHKPSWGLTMPWAIAVPLGFVTALWAVEHRDRFDGMLGEALESIHVLKCLFVRPRHLIGPLGTAVYWFGDIACLWACLQAFTHGTPDIELLLIGYATGYALSRRTLPFGGAGAVESLLPFALSWCGISLAAAVLAVFTYRIFNFWLPTLPAAFGLKHLQASSTSPARS